MKTVILALIGIAGLASAQCVLKPNPDTGLLDCTGGPTGPQGPPGAGITTLNTLTALTQTFAVGTAGSDFNISSATSTHTINCPTASATVRGCISTADWSIFNSKEFALTFSAPLSRSGNTISIPVATSGQNGYLASADWTTFNGKESALTFSSPLSRATNTISIPVATSSANGYLASADWVTFNAKYGSGSSPSFANITFSGNLTRTPALADGCATWASGVLDTTGTACGSGSGGEENTTADVGGGLSLRGATPKTGVALNLRTLAATAPITVAQATDLITFAMPAATGSVNGYLSSTDWSTFNGREPHTANLTFLGGLANTDDTVIVNNGTAPQLKVLPDCDDPTLSKLLYDQATNAFSCGTDQSTGPGGSTGTAAARDFSSSQYWLYPYAASPTSSQHGFANCDYSRTITSGGSESPPYDVHCHSTPGTQTVNGQTVGQYDLLVSWVSATAGRVALNFGGNANTAAALTANGTNCSAGSFPLGVAANGDAEGCTALPTTISGTANQITASAATGGVVLSIPASPVIVTPTIASFTNATHNHTNAAGGGQITDAALSAAVTVAKGGTGLTGGTSGGIPYYSSGSAMLSSALLATGATVVGGGAGAAPASSTLTASVTKHTSGVPAAATAVDVSAPGSAADAGSTDAYVATLSPVPTLTTGTEYRFKANTANTGPATINFNSLGNITIKKVAGGITTDLADNDIRAGQWVTVIYDGANMQIQSAGGNAASGSVGSNVPSCTKYTVSETALTTAATTQDITVVTLPARSKVQGITIEPTTQWAGASVSALTVSLGVSGSTTAYTSAYSLITASTGVVPGDTAFQDDGGHYSPTLASHAVLARFTSTGANVNAMTAGAVAFSICSVVLP